MLIKHVCTYWGQQGMSAAEFIYKVIDSGYDGIEIDMPLNDKFEKELFYQP
ncbi:MAG TPA: hypothetical protein VGQ09_16705 [Chitinophagaceae bacterium]|jgi:hypothetical protein|nr:hypothetical protein [Chitinophagaceae bacterium]